MSWQKQTSSLVRIFLFNLFYFLFNLKILKKKDLEVLKRTIGEKAWRDLNRLLNGSHTIRIKMTWKTSEPNMAGRLLFDEFRFWKESSRMRHRANAQFNIEWWISIETVSGRLMFRINWGFQKYTRRKIA